MFPTPPDLRDQTHAYILPLHNRTSGLAFDPRCHYAETYWLPILGPSTMWLLRKMAERFDTEPEGFKLDLIEMSQELGIASRGGRNNAFHRAIGRVVTFKMGKTIDEQTIAVKRQLPALHNGQVRRLPPTLANRHDEVIRQQRTNAHEDRRRSENVAFTLLQLGDSPDLVEQQLVSWGIDSQLSKEAVDVAWANKARHDQALANGHQADSFSY